MGKYLWILRNKKAQLSNEEVARQIGQYFPEISDKLLNIIQLESLSDSQNELLLAAIRQKSRQISTIPFATAIDYSKNRKYFRYAIIPAAIILLLLVFLPQSVTESSARIIRYNEAFIPEPPFSFSITNEPLRAFKGETYKVKLQTEGRAMP